MLAQGYSFLSGAASSSRDPQLLDHPAAGKYNERAFKALDYILDEASKVGVRLILTMADNWSPADSKTQVTNPPSLSTSAPKIALFCDVIIQICRARAWIITRTVIWRLEESLFCDIIPYLSQWILPHQDGLPVLTFVGIYLLHR